MLERYFIRPQTLDQIRASWIGEPIERYVTWLTEEGYASRNVFHRVPVLRHFGEFARARGATRWEDLPAHVAAFVEAWVQERGAGRQTPRARKELASEARNPVEQMLHLVVASFTGRARTRWARKPFPEHAGAFFAHLREERGLREASVHHYRHYLAQFDVYLRGIELHDLRALSPAVLGAFVADRSAHLGRTSLRNLCGVVRVFLRYLHRELVLATDLSPSVESPQAYRLATLPRAITWDDVRRMLEAVDRRAATGKRDYAILLLLVTYGLRAREVAALTLDDLDWKRDRLRVPERKAGHSTAYPLSPTVGAALVDYLQHARPKTSERAVFFRVLAPRTPLPFEGPGGRVRARFFATANRSPRLTYAHHGQLLLVNHKARASADEGFRYCAKCRTWIGSEEGEQEHVDEVGRNRCPAGGTHVIQELVHALITKVSVPRLSRSPSRGYQPDEWHEPPSRRGPAVCGRRIWRRERG